MALTELTQVTGPGIHTLSNVLSHNIKSSGIITATKFSGPLDSIGGNFTGVITATSANFTGNVSIGGTLTYEDVTNIDSVGIVTARDHIKIITDNKRLSLGASEDFRLYHDGTYNKIDNAGTTDLFITVNNYGEYAAKFKANNSVDLFYDGTKKFETSSTGINITGTVTATGADINGDLDVDGHTNLDNGNVAGIVTFNSGSALHTNGGQILLFDRPDGNSNNLFFGTGGKAVAYHSGTNFSIVNNTGHSYIGVGAASKDLYLYAQTSGNVVLQQNTGVRYVKGVGSDASVQLFFNNNLRLNTTTAGVSIPNDLDVDGHTNLDNVSIAGVTTMTGDLYMPNKIYHVGDTDTYLHFDTNTINLHAGGTTGLSVLDASVRVPTKLGINGAAPQTPLDVIANGSGYAMAIRGRSSDNTADIRFTSNDYGTIYGQIVTGPTYLNLKTGGVERLQLDTTETTFNDTGADTDFRVRSPAQTHMFYVDAGNNQVSIKTSSAASGAVLTVNGRTHTDTQFTIGSNSTLDAGVQATIYKPDTNMLAFATAGANERLRLDNSGRVHIGHTSNIAVAGSNPRVQVTGTSDSTAHLSIRNFSANTTGAILSLAKSRGSVGAYTAVQDDDVLGQINFAGADGTDLAEVAGKITVACDATVAGNRIPSRMEFHTTDGNGNLDLNMVITRDGQLYLPQGITRDAMYNLAHSTANDLILGRTTGGADTGMTLVSPSATSGFINFADADGQRQGSILYQHGSGSDKMFFRTNNNQTGLIIDSAQKVYVGDASANISPSIGGKMLVSNTNMSLNSFANNQHAQTFHFTKSRATSGSGGSIVGSGDFCGHIEWYADDGVDTANQIAKISGQMDGSPGANDTPGKLLFYTTADGANTSTLRMQITNGGVMHIGSTAVSNTIPTGGLDLQGNNTNCVLEMGNPLPNYSAGRVPTFRITTTDADKKVDLSSIWGGDNGIHKHMTLQGGSTIFYNGTNDTEIARITDTGLVVGTTNFSDAHNTDDGTAILKNGHVITRCTSGTNNKLYTAKTIDTGSAIALRVLSAQTQVGSVSFNSGGTSFNTSSDYRRKENVIDLTGAITRLKTLKPKRFNFISNPSVTLDGFLAHEVTAVPEAVIGTKDEVATEDSEDYSKGDPIYQQLDQSKLVPLLVAALQEAVARIEALESP